MEKQDSPVRRIAIIGLPASGKTTVGRRLAALSGLPFVDMDEAIEAEAGSSVSRIFEAEGEAGFRVREARALELFASGGAVVLATGGGVVLAGGNRALLRDRFTVVWLSIAPDVAARRSIGGARPLLVGADPFELIASLDVARRALYAECADMTICADETGVERLAEEIHDAIR